jgi:hypothetical protein
MVLRIVAPLPETMLEAANIAVGDGDVRMYPA